MAVISDDQVSKNKFAKFRKACFAKSSAQYYIEMGFRKDVSSVFLVPANQNTVEINRLITNVIIGILLVLFSTVVVTVFFVAPSLNPNPSNNTWGDRSGRYDWPPPSNSLLGRFEKAAITCDHGRCSEVGRDIMIKGGNAIDAAIAALFCLGVTNPQSSGIGGGFIMTFYNQTSKTCIAIDARETAPRAATWDINWMNPETGSVYKSGEILKQPTLANTLETIANAEDPVELFYKGEMADIIAAEFAENEAIITKADLKKYKPRIYHTPLKTTPFLDGLIMCGPPPPSSFAITQSIVQVGIKNYCNHTIEDNPWDLLYNDPYYYHFLIETQKFANSHRSLLGDIAFVPKAWRMAQNLATDDYSEWIYLRQKIKAQKADYYGDYNSTVAKDHGTSHVSVVDPFGNGVSVTSTINHWFGASVQSSKLGIVWNNEMDAFSKPNYSKKDEIPQSRQNYIQPGKRPMASMSPMVMYSNETGKLVMVIGASGGNKIVSSIGKTIVRVLCFNETIKEAIDAPNLHSHFPEDVTEYEKTMPAELIQTLIDRNLQKMKPSTGFEGIVQGIYIDEDDVIWANGDFRRRTNMSPGGF
uniref:Gamma-glutamyltransferase n=1 Tax=Panagrellus redivivus TaxID=6233 RepID=A0A7E4ZZ68_PANRE